MSLANLVQNGTVFEDVDPGYISESAMEQLCAIAAMETLNPDEMEQYVAENMEYTALTESQRNIVKLNKEAQKNRMYKVGILQSASEANDKLYRKIRLLWAAEAKLFKQMEKRYKNKAMAKARAGMKELGKKKTMGPTVANRIEKQMKGTGNLMQSGPKKAR